MKTKILGLLAVGLLAGPMAGQATTIWDESVDGDLSTNGNTFLGSLGGGTWDLFGSLDGGAQGSNAGSDERDGISFTALGNWTLDVTALTLASAPGLVPFLYDASNTFLGALNVAAAPQSNIFGLRPAGSYSISFVPTTNTGQLDYSLRFNVAAVPEPGTLALLGLGLAGLGLGRRRKAN